MRQGKAVYGKRGGLRSKFGSLVVGGLVDWVVGSIGLAVTIGLRLLNADNNRASTIPLSVGCWWVYWRW